MIHEFRPDRVRFIVRIKRTDSVSIKGQNVLQSEQGDHDDLVLLKRRGNNLGVRPNLALGDIEPTSREVIGE